MNNNALLERNNSITLAARNLEDRKTIIFCDFDGTVTTSDVTDLLLEQLAKPAWRDIEDRWVNGEIDDCQCMSQQVALIDAAWPKIARVLDNSVSIDPHFKSFMALCNEMEIPVYIGSNGLDKVISYVLNRENIQVDGYWAYKLVEANKSWSLEFPEGEKRTKCKTAASVACKCALLEKKFAYNDPYKIVIGDSKSDFCWSTKADFVFAKSKLAQYCREQNLDHETFVDFSQIANSLEEFLQSEIAA